MPPAKPSSGFHPVLIRACNIVEIGSSALYFVDPKIDLDSRNYLLPITIPETGNNFDRLHASICEEFDDVPLFDLHIFDTFPSIDTLLPA
jgi:hypothetical protein